MAEQRADLPRLTATFTPGGFDDYYLPTSPDIAAPAPQRVMQELPDQITDQIKTMEIGGQQSQRASTHSSTPRINSISSTASSNEPNFNPFPTLTNRTSNVPPADDEKAIVLESARLPVLASSDPEVQLMWAQDALTFSDITTDYNNRINHVFGSRPATPSTEKQVRADAINIISFLADQHHPRAEFLKGLWLEFAKFGNPQDKTEAFRSYKRAAERGYARAEYRMGMMFESTNQTQDALSHYRAGEAAGDAASCYRLGMMALLGQMGQPQDFVRAVTLIRHSADHADENAPQGAYVFGMLLAKELPQIKIPENFLPPDASAARIYLERAAFLGFSKAQLRIGSAYELCSLGCEFSPILSIHYNRLAARQGEAEAEMAISKWCLCGYEGVFAKNEEIAYKFAERASSDGLATALFAMGYFHEIGMYVPVNVDKALEWYRKAAANGSKDAETRIQQILMHRTLSKKDHEQVAVKRIQSTHASRRGSRPSQLQQQSAEQPYFPAVANDLQNRPSSTVQAPQSNSIAPYPLHDGPRPLSTPIGPYANGNGIRPHSAAPYPVGADYRATALPVDGGPRPNSIAAPDVSRPSDGGPPGGRSSIPYPPGPPTGGRPSPGHRLPAPGRGPSGHTVSQGPMLPPKTPAGQAGLRADPRMDSYTGPAAGEHIRGSRTPDFASRPNLPGNRMASSTTPGRGNSPARPQAASGHPTMSGAMPTPATGSASSTRPPTSNTKNTIRIERQPGKGPATFEEMGIPKAKADGDCAIM